MPVSSADPLGEYVDDPYSSCTPSTSVATIRSGERRSIPRFDKRQKR